jgi:hypothetical protein
MIRAENDHYRGALSLFSLSWLNFHGAQAGAGRGSAPLRTLSRLPPGLATNGLPARLLVRGWRI